VARKHSKLTVIVIAANDVSTFCTDSNCEQSSGTEDVTTYGKNAVVKDPTLLDGAFGCSGKYDSEGTGTGLPQDSFDAVITKYTETAPVAGYRLWSLETEPSDTWDSTAQ
jgi:hypothetical protein